MASWFASWFDSPYYHILYKNRSEAEAKRFIDHLIHYLQPESGAKVLDLACGKGRHSAHLATKGLDVLGVDLSKESIELAKKMEHEHLRFGVHDMRESLPEKDFDLICNLFTSFGYFKTKAVHQQVVTHMADGLKKGGKLVIDFLNAHRVRAKLVPEEQKEVNGILFDLKRFVQDGKIIKQIKFENQGNAYNFEEQVALFQLEDFQEFMTNAGLKLLATFGNYDLEPFDLENSTRLILIAEKC